MKIIHICFNKSLDNYTAASIITTNFYKDILLSSFSQATGLNVKEFDYIIKYHIFDKDSSINNLKNEIDDDDICFMLNCELSICDLNNIQEMLESTKCWIIGIYNSMNIKFQYLTFHIFMPIHSITSIIYAYCKLIEKWCDKFICTLDSNKISFSKFIDTMIKSTIYDPEIDFNSIMRLNKCSLEPSWYKFIEMYYKNPNDKVSKKFCLGAEILGYKLSLNGLVFPFGIDDRSDNFIEQVSDIGEHYLNDFFYDENIEILGYTSFFKIFDDYKLNNNKIYNVFCINSFKVNDATINIILNTYDYLCNYWFDGNNYHYKLICKETEDISSSDIANFYKGTIELGKSTEAEWVYPQMIFKEKTFVHLYKPTLKSRKDD